MEYKIFRSDQRGRFENEWLSTRFSFSFGNWYNPGRMGFSALRVFNDDVIAPHSGFGPHPHQNMEIVTIMKKGELTHGDDFGQSQSRLEAGEVQVMSAGDGVVHSEKNDGDEEVELFQLWFLPKDLNIEPRYDQKHFDWAKKTNQWTEIISPKSLPLRDTLQINQDVFLSIGIFDQDTTLESHMKATAMYVHIVEGSIEFDGEVVEAGDAIEIKSTASISVKIDLNATILLIELPSIS